MKTKFKKFLNDKKVKVLDKKAKTKVNGKGGSHVYVNPLKEDQGS